MKRKRVILSAGGTGGHLFPAQAVAHELDACDCLFVAGGLSTSPYFNREKFKFLEINTATFSLTKPLSVMKGGKKIAVGLLQSRKIISTFKPDLVVGFGSFFTLPLLLAAKMQRVPLLLHEQNSLPGKVNRLFSTLGVETAITFPQSENHLKGKTTLTDYPLRWGLDKKNREEALEYYHLDKDKKTLLIFGGSQGAKRLNSLFLETVPLLSKDLQILHFVGNHAMKEMAEEVYRREGRRVCVKEFEARMDLAFSVCDMAICRAGASTIAELIEWEIPALLIPFPFATNLHQDHNASHFVEVGGGSSLFEKELKKEVLHDAIVGLLEKLEAKKNELASYKRRKNNQSLKELILERI